MLRVLQWLCTGFILTLPDARAAVVMPDDGPYYQIRHNRTLYIYDASSRDFIAQVIASVDAIKRSYQTSFDWKLDEELDVILTSGRQQVANAYATALPNLKTVWYPSGAAMLEEMAASSWLLTLASHETAHVYQLNAKGSLNRRLSKIFGNGSPSLWPGVLPVFMQPNFYAPTSMLEGNAVMNESRIGLGGRLHSGEKRALVLAQVRAGLIDPSRLINDEFRFPFNEEAYLQGGYFQAHLASKYGVDRSNAFFRAQGGHYLNPLILNQTFREHFGESYSQEVREYVRAQELLAVKQQFYDQAALMRAKYFSPLNHDATTITFLSTDGYESPVLHVFDKKSRAAVSPQVNLIFGKPFNIDGETWTAAAWLTDLHHRDYGLYDRSAHILKGTAGQIINDRRAGKTVALDAVHSWMEPRLLLNGTVYDVAHSTPILDELGNVYYFQQSGKLRTLMRNREPLFNFEGYYGKVMEIDPADGSVYFIANTEYGSSLYQWNGKEILRVLTSDRVIDARSLNRDEFLVIEVGAHGHAAFIVPALRTPARPAVYSYPFEQTTFTPSTALTAPQVKEVEESYHGFRQLRYSGLDMAMLWGPHSGLRTIANLSFTDPLQFNTVNVAIDQSELASKAYVAQFTYSKYLLDVFARYQYEERPWNRKKQSDIREYNQNATLGLVLPVWRSGRWSADLSVASFYSKDDFDRVKLANTPTDGDQETFGALSTASLNYSVDPLLSFLPWRAFNITAKNRIETGNNNWRKDKNVSQISTGLVHGFHDQFFATWRGSLTWAEDHDIKVDYGLSPLSSEIAVSRLTGHNPTIDAKTVGTVAMELQKVMELSSYSARIPLGVNRLAPFLIGQAVFLDDDNLNLYPNDFFEWGYGVDIEFLLIHKLPFRFRMMAAYDTRNPYHPENQFSLNMAQSF